MKHAPVPDEAEVAALRAEVERLAAIKRRLDAREVDVLDERGRKAEAAELKGQAPDLRLRMARARLALIEAEAARAERAMPGLRMALDEAAQARAVLLAELADVHERLAAADVPLRGARGSLGRAEAAIRARDKHGPSLRKLIGEASGEPQAERRSSKVARILGGGL